MTMWIAVSALIFSLGAATLNVAHFAGEVAYALHRPVLAAAIYPWDYRYQFQVGYLAMVARDYRQATRSYSRLLGLFPTFIEARANLAVVWAMRGEPRIAERLLLEVLAVDPGYQSARANLKELRKAKR